MNRTFKEIAVDLVEFHDSNGKTAFLFLDVVDDARRLLRSQKTLSEIAEEVFNELSFVDVPVNGYATDDGPEIFQAHLKRLVNMYFFTLQLLASEARGDLLIELKHAALTNNDYTDLYQAIISIITKYGGAELSNVETIEQT